MKRPWVAIDRVLPAPSSRLLLDARRTRTARLWFILEAAGGGAWDRLDVSRCGTHICGLDAWEFHHGISREERIAEVDRWFTHDDIWSEVLGLRDWFDVVKAGLCPGRAFYAEVSGRWYQSGWEYAEYDFDCDWHVVEQEPMSPKKVAARIESLLKRADVKMWRAE